MPQLDNAVFMIILIWTYTFYVFVYLDLNFTSLFKYINFCKLLYKYRIIKMSLQNYCLYYQQAVAYIWSNFYL